MRLTAGLLCCLLLFTCRPQKSFSSRNHGCLFDLRLCSKEEVCVQDGLFGQCRERTERDVGQIQVTPGTLQHLQDVLRQLTAKGMSWRDDMTQRIMAHKMGHLPQHRPIEPLDVLDDERYPPVFRTPGRTVQRLSGAVQPSTPRWVGSNDQLQYFRPRLSSSASSEVPTVQQQRLSGSIKKNTSPLVDRYLTYILLNSQTPSSQRSNTQENLPPLHSYTKFTYQDKSHVRNPLRLFGASNSWPEGSSRISFGRYQGGQEMPLPIHLPSERHQAWADLRRKLPRESVDSDLPEDVLDSSEMIERLSQLSDGDQDPQPDSRSEPPRTLRGAAGIQMKPVPQTELETQDIDDVQSLVGALERYGLDLRQLSEPQLEQLSAVLQLIQSDAVLNQGTRNPDRSPSKRITEGEMQHMAVAEPQFPPPEMSPSSFPTATNAELDKTGSVRSTSATINMLTKPDTQTRGEEPDNLRGPINEGQEQRLLDKKSYPEGGLMIDVPQVTEEYGYIMTNQTPLSLLNGARLLETLAERVHLSTASFINNSVVGSSLTFQIKHNHQNLSLMDVANRAGALKSDLETSTGVKIIQTGVAQRNKNATVAHTTHFGDTFRFVLLIFIALACIAGIVIASAVIFCLRQHAKQREKERLAALGPEGAGDTTFEYQDLCRQHMAGKSLFSRTDAPGAAENSRVSSVSSQFSDIPQPSPSSHSSTPSWCEEPVQSNMDISTGHMILAYMEDHLRNRDRLAKEWQALCAYQAEPNACAIAKSDANLKKNRNPDYVPYDHARIKLRSDTNPSRSDYINASPIIEHDPRMPAYIATHGPLSHTIADFWQMVWENGCTVIVMLSPLAEDGVKQCDRYWPDEGSSLYHIYEVNLVSEHIWCEDFLVRSFYLKNVQTQETRTLTQFHFLSWPAEGIPSSTRPLLDFRRKVNKSFRGRSCPIIVHCSDGAGRTGTYILVDMVLNRMAKGVKEIDIAASLEHVRDQRAGMVRTKDQFEFALTAVAEEVNAILKALPQ
ncbi:receptor-type tyrosine-protein phosphatase-like N [Bombina bombina]|uniref:receptor-type tyrosine-protein phosphatase-like N n=1 Tax=Bombina bombina TaxID=8345 RepID=UPI00235A9B3E|nr:receptor-type tyrosine-protein phosphatase-like N [Bombina bombina]